MSAPDPATHRCDVPTIDYSLVASGFLLCDVAQGGCGRAWTFVDPKVFHAESGGVGWRPSPVPVGAPQRYAERQRAAARPVSRGEGPW